MAFLTFFVSRGLMQCLQPHIAQSNEWVCIIWRGRILYRQYEEVLTLINTLHTKKWITPLHQWNLNQQKWKVTIFWVMTPLGPDCHYGSGKTFFALFKHVFMTIPCPNVITSVDNPIQIQRRILSLLVKSQREEHLFCSWLESDFILAVCSKQNIPPGCQ